MNIVGYNGDFSEKLPCTVGLPSEKPEVVELMEKNGGSNPSLSAGQLAAEHPDVLYPHWGKKDCEAILAKYK